LEGQSGNIRHLFEAIGNFEYHVSGQHTNRIAQIHSKVFYRGICYPNEMTKGLGFRVVCR
jgi:hypothetical protein